MVRLEKILYERLFNTSLLGRQRSLSKPTKWFGEGRDAAQFALAQRFFGTGISGMINRIVEPFFAWASYRYPKDIANSKGTLKCYMFESA